MTLFETLEQDPIAGLLVFAFALLLIFFLFDYYAGSEFKKHDDE